MILVIVLVCMRVEREIIEEEEEDKVGGLRDGLSSISDHKIVSSEE